MSETKIEPIKRMTTIITFKRQLWPQPPADARPDWYLTNTVGFYKSGKKVWEQEIPERCLFFEKGFYEWLHVPRFYLRDAGSCTLIQDKTFGWCIEFQVRYEEAAKFWELLFKDHPEIGSSWDEKQGQFFFDRIFLPEPGPEQVDVPSPDVDSGYDEEAEEMHAAEVDAKFYAEFDRLGIHDINEDRSDD
jgi:hypothetical protein